MLLKPRIPIAASEVFRLAGVRNSTPFAHLTLPFTPREDQISAINWLLRYNRFGLFSETRTGKTIVMQMGILYCAHYGYKTTFIMPAILFDQFQETWNDIQGPKPSLFVLEAGPEKREKLFKSWESRTAEAPSVLILSQQIFNKVQERLSMLGYRNLLFDESHQGLQQEESKICLAINRFIAHQDTRLVLSTGTPIPTEVQNVYPTISLLYPGAYLNQRDFNRWHVINKTIYVRNKRGEVFPRAVPDSYVNLDFLHQVLYKQAWRVTKAQVLDLKAPNIQVMPVHLSGPHFALYKQLLKQRFLMFPNGELIDAKHEAKLRQTALQLVANPEEFTDRKLTNNLFELADQLVDSIGPKKNKILLFANYNLTVNSLVARYEKLNPARVYGGEGGGTGANRKEIDRFKHDDTCRILVANPEAGGVGLTLGHVCTHVIVVEPMSSPGDFEQAISRVILDGQTEPVVVYILSVQGTGHVSAVNSMLGRAQDIKTVNSDKQTLLDELLPGN